MVCRYCLTVDSATELSSCVGVQLFTIEMDVSSEQLEIRVAPPTNPGTRTVPAISNALALELTVISRVCDEHQLRRTDTKSLSYERLSPAFHERQDHRSRPTTRFFANTAPRP